MGDVTVPECLGTDWQSLKLSQITALCPLWYPQGYLTVSLGKRRMEALWEEESFSVPQVEHWCSKTVSGRFTAEEETDLSFVISAQRQQGEERWMVQAGLWKWAQTDTWRPPDLIPCTIGPDCKDKEMG